jgi:hypothetical protein
MTTATVGDTSFLANYLINTRVYGVVVPGNSEPEFYATYEIQGDQGTLFLAAVVGADGEAGQDAIALHIQTDPYDSPDDLPHTLTNTPADIGKYWVMDDVNADGDIIGSSMYVWFGTSWRRLMLGSPGPPGPVPIITPTVDLVDPEVEGSDVDVSGTPTHPDWALHLAVPPGPQGPGAALALAPDVDFATNVPVPGDVLGFTGRYTTDTPAKAIWVPVSISQLIPSPYSMPENAFTSFSGISQRAAIGSFVIPPQPFPWTPIVWGHIGAFGIELSANPLLIGCEVLLGSSTTGHQIARGFGNSLGEVNIMPHYSTPTTPSNALTPTNGVATVPPNHSNPAEGTIYVNLYNDGAIGLYQFSPTDAQIFVMVVPVIDNALADVATFETTRRRR